MGKPRVESIILADRQILSGGSYWIDIFFPEPGVYKFMFLRFRVHGTDSWDRIARENREIISIGNDIIYSTSLDKPPQINIIHPGRQTSGDDDTTDRIFNSTIEVYRQSSVNQRNAYNGHMRLRIDVYDMTSIQIFHDRDRPPVFLLPASDDLHAVNIDCSSGSSIQIDDYGNKWINYDSRLGIR